MVIFKAILVIIEVVTCFLLISLILIQKTKSQGAGMAFGASMGESLFGAQTGNVLTKATVFLTIVFLVNTTILAVLTPGRVGSITDSVTSRIPVSASATHTAQTPAAPQSGGAPLNLPASPAQTAPAQSQPAAAPISIPAPPVSADAGTQPAK